MAVANDLAVSPTQAVAVTLGVPTADSAPTPDQIDERVRQRAKARGIDPDWAVATRHAETGGDSNPQSDVSPKGAIGGMQLMPGTAADLGVNPRDWQQNVDGGVDYLAQLYNKYGDKSYATLAYNAGPGRVDQWLSSKGQTPLPIESFRYLGNVMPEIGHILDMDGGAGGAGGAQSRTQLDSSYIDREQAELGDIYGRKNAAIEPITQQVIKNNQLLQTQLDEALLRVRQSELPPDYKFQVPPPQTDIVKAFGSAASIFAVAASAFTHTPAIAAMNALAGVVNAQKAGDRQAYEDQFQQFQENTKIALERHKQATEEMDTALKLMTQNINSGVAMANMVAAKYGDEVHMAELRAGGYEKLNEQLLAANKSADLMKFNYDKLEAEKKANDEKNKTLRENKDAEIAAQKEIQAKKAQLAKELAEKRAADTEKLEREREDAAKKNTDARIASEKEIAGLKASTSAIIAKDRFGSNEKIAELRANTTKSVAAGHDATSEHNTDTRANTTKSVAAGHDATSEHNTDTRASTSAIIAKGHDATSSSNTDKRVAASEDETTKKIVAGHQNLSDRLAEERDIWGNRIRAGIDALNARLGVVKELGFANIDSRNRNTDERVNSANRNTDVRVNSNNQNTDKRLQAERDIAGERIAASGDIANRRIEAAQHLQDQRLAHDDSTLQKKFDFQEVSSDAKMRFEQQLAAQRIQAQIDLEDKKLAAEKEKGAFGNPTSVEYRDGNGLLRSTQAIWDKNNKVWVDIAAPRGPNGELPKVSNVVNVMKAGDDSTPEDRERLAQAIASYRHAPFTAYAAGMGQNQTIISRVLQLNPGYTEQLYYSSQKAYNDYFGDGKITQSLRQINASVSHIALLNKAIDALKNGDQKTISAIGNQLKTEMNLSTAPTDFDTIQSVVTDEVSKFITGGVTAEGTRERYNKLFDRNNSGEILHSAVNELYGLMAGQLRPIAQQYKRNTFRNDFFDAATGFLDPEVKQVLGFRDDGSIDPRQQPDPSQYKPDPSQMYGATIELGHTNEDMQTIDKLAPGTKFRFSDDPPGYRTR